MLQENAMERTNRHLQGERNTFKKFKLVFLLAFLLSPIAVDLHLFTTYSLIRSCYFATLLFLGLGRLFSLF